VVVQQEDLPHIYKLVVVLVFGSNLEAQVEEQVKLRFAL
jgi:hypothetical protein